MNVDSSGGSVVDGAPVDDGVSIVLDLDACDSVAMDVV